MSQERLMKVLLTPHNSEKTTLVAEKYRQFVFKVLPDANKVEIKQAVEKLFKVKVDRVRLCNIKGKVKRHQQVLGRRKHEKKAYVSLAEGHDINFMNLSKK
ncbi:MAG: 50S ribosomal protein L23 [Pseudomonadota bacterium]